MLLNTDSLLKVTCKPSQNVKTWLSYPYSLTKKLKSVSGDARLEILNQCWRPSDWWDNYALLIHDKKVLCREIMMHSNGEPCWYARTVIPEYTYQAGDHLFLRLQYESLGEIIFDNPNIKRVLFCGYGVNQNNIEYHWIDPGLRLPAEVIWLRLSVFMLHEQFPFYLAELLMPGIERYADEHGGLS
ncbi:chorismate--pyruvate lyase family protein [Legionella londiniensis]|uniref:4-hydroxybenzoate synthetase n=1 Tax=Legionella londiniensis TaxID=45068 RepID=A0A0W0VQK6_9GAMM|nr:chorismate lyase [Legionella londiniensis]KTD22339.1 4-hydroxybenzoate synthetase [Legionella londiniensis]